MIEYHRGLANSNEREKKRLEAQMRVVMGDAVPGNARGEPGAHEEHHQASRARDEGGAHHGQ